jgi:protein-tyrosine-phosphatase
MLLRHLAGNLHSFHAAGLDVGSQHRSGAALCSEMRDYLKRSGVSAADMEAHASVAVTAEALQAADLILVMTKEQRAAVARISPSAQHKTFLLTQAARFSQWFLDADQSEFTAGSLLGWWGLARAHAGFAEDPDVVDAHVGERVTHAEVIPLVDSSIRVIARACLAVDPSVVTRD